MVSQHQDNPSAQSDCPAGDCQIPPAHTLASPAGSGTPAAPPAPRNGYRRAILTTLATVSLTVLLYAAVLVLAAGLELSRDRAIVLAVFLGLHTFALTLLTGQSPWPHLLQLLNRPSSGSDDRTTP